MSVRWALGEANGNFPTCTCVSYFSGYRLPFGDVLMKTLTELKMEYFGGDGTLADRELAFYEKELEKTGTMADLSREYYGGEGTLADRKMKFFGGTGTLAEREYAYYSKELEKED